MPESPLPQPMRYPSIDEYFVQLPDVPPVSIPRRPPRRALRRTLIVVSVTAVLVTGAAGAQLARPVPEPVIRPTIAVSGHHTFSGSAPVLPWPDQGQAAVHVEGTGTMGTQGGSVPTPTASVAKVMTAYVFLREHPLTPGSDGPTFTVSAEEAARLPERKARGESHIDVVANQPFTERAALEALLIVSANNIAHELARWDSGGDIGFVSKMNAAAQELGMTATTYTDPSGYDPGTVSTAADQVILLRAAMRLPVFAEIAGEREYVPADGGPARTGGNTLLGQDGVIGGKTGFTSAAGGNYVFAARRRIGGADTLIVGAVLDQPGAGNAAGAVEAGRRLVVAAGRALTSAVLARAGEQVAVVDDGLGGRTPLVAAVPVTVVGWSGLTVRVSVEGSAPERAASGARLGSVTAGARRIPLVLERPLDGPSIRNRLLRQG